MPSSLGSFEVLRQLLSPKIKCLRPFSVQWRAEGGGSFNAKFSREVPRLCKALARNKNMQIKEVLTNLCSYIFRRYHYYYYYLAMSRVLNSF